MHTVSLRGGHTHIQITTKAIHSHSWFLQAHAVTHLASPLE